MKTGQLRQLFLDYFEKLGHTVVSSSSLVPNNDPTLLFTNAGMVQFKEVFLGAERPYVRAASAQRCVRAGGKHNDLENVGYTARHHTFFEMLGNFSFGDYFKRDAVKFAWTFLTDILQLPPERLWVTVFEDDPETEAIWLTEMGIDKTRFSRCGTKDNFWSMGDTGPCGPCSEIFYDHGPLQLGGPPGSSDADGDRYVEIWNLVFMQYNRLADGTLSPLPKPSVDTGMGLERIAAVMQGVHSNYEIDIFQQLIRAIVELGNIQEVESKSLRVLADHIRSCTFLILDGVLPSNEGRGYVLRRIARRAIRHGHRLGFVEPFFYRLVMPLIQEMGDAYPELHTKQTAIEQVLHQEEVQFRRTLEQGLKIFEQAVQNMNGSVIPGEIVFRLSDTHGFPVDLTEDIAREKGLSLDMPGFHAAMEIQKSRARAASQFHAAGKDEIKTSHITDFVGYDSLQQGSEIVALYKNGQPVEEIHEGEVASVVLLSTPFYAESGGQVGDQGFLSASGATFEVQNTYKVDNAYVHQGVLKNGLLKIGVTVLAAVNAEKRSATALNHSATHLLHAALRQLLGNAVQQKGSLVDADRLRFDFSHTVALTVEEIGQIEQLVNEKIRENSVVKTEILPVEEALKSGAIALFGEKYGQEVRVLRMGENFSVEFCGGTHVRRTGDIGMFKIVTEYGVSAGVRRIEALTGAQAVLWINKLENRLKQMALLLKCGNDAIEEKIQQLAVKNRQFEKELQGIKHNIGMTGGGIEQETKEIKGIKVLTARLPMGDMATLRNVLDQMKNKLHSAIIVLASVNDAQKVTLIAGVTPDCVDKIKADELIQYVAKQIGGQGGGRSDMAQGGGTQPEQLEQALISTYRWVEERL